MLDKKHFEDLRKSMGEPSETMQTIWAWEDKKRDAVERDVSEDNDSIPQFTFSSVIKVKK